jgi:hypothetical protein
MDILHEAPNLLQRYRYGDAFRLYVQRHRPLVAAALAVFLAFSTATTAGVVVFFGGTHSLVVLACLVLAPFILAGSLFVQTFVFFSWLELRALGQRELPPIPWALAAAFVVVPLLALALLSIKIAVTLLFLSALTPLAYSLLDGD